MLAKETIVVCTLYKFAKLANFTELRTPLLEFMRAQQIRGTILLAKEGLMVLLLVANRQSLRYVIGLIINHC